MNFGEILKYNEIWKTRKNFAFTLAEVLIVLGIIGIIAEITIPVLVQGTQEQEIVSEALNFSSNLQQAILQWKLNANCGGDARDCFIAQNFQDGQATNFESTIGQNLYITDKVYGTNTKGWLPADTKDYYGNTNTNVFGKVSRNCANGYMYLTKDGTTFSIDFDPDGLNFTVDVNGVKGPNRMGKDTFSFTVGKISGKDIYYYPYYNNGEDNTSGLCLASSACNPNNLNPNQNGGASPTAYILLNRKFPKYP